MNRQGRQLTAGLMAGLMVLASALTSSAQTGAQGIQPQTGLPSSQMPGELKQVDFEQRLNAPLPLDLAFRDETGATVTLGDYFKRRPVVLTFVYYTCTMLCTQVLTGITSSLIALDETVGRDFDVVAVSFDPRDTPMAAAAKKAAHIDRYGRAGSASGFHFLTGDESSIRALTDAVGFKYQWDEATQQYAHASGFVVATPDGRLSRYFYGIEYAPRDLKFALIESSAGRVGSIVDQVLLYCYHYDPKSGSYSFVAMKAVRLGGAFTLLALAGFVVVALRRDERVRH